jgi:ABC-2 type transport system permease protein
MNAILLIARRELGNYFKTWIGYIIIAAALFLAGLWFNGHSMGQDKRSSEILSDFFLGASGVVFASSIFISMRLLAGEREHGTVNLLYSSPVRDVQIVVGKFLAGLGFMAVLVGTTLYMPLLLLIAGKISWGHLFVGYVGLLLYGSATLAVGTFASALVGSQILSVIIAALINLSLLLMWWIGRITERPLSQVFENLAIYNLHFPPFQSGVLHVRDVVYYLAVTYVALFAATRVLEARRWR